MGEEALAIGIYAALSAESFVEAIQIATNHSGDSDSTASIAGQLWGAMNGMDGIPHVWVSALDVLSPLLHLARQFLAHLCRSQRLRAISDVVAAAVRYGENS